MEYIKEKVKLITNMQFSRGRKIIIGVFFSIICIISLFFIYNYSLNEGCKLLGLGKTEKAKNYFSIAKNLKVFGNDEQNEKLKDNIDNIDNYSNMYKEGMDYYNKKDYLNCLRKLVPINKNVPEYYNKSKEAISKSRDEILKVNKPLILKLYSENKWRECFNLASEIVPYVDDKNIMECRNNCDDKLQEEAKKQYAIDKAKKEKELAEQQKLDQQKKDEQQRTEQQKNAEEQNRASKTFNGFYVSETHQEGDYISGTIVNNTGANCRYVEIDINLMDENGNQVGSTLDNVNNLQSGGKWKFKAPVLEKSTRKYKVIDVSGR